VVETVIVTEVVLAPFSVAELGETLQVDKDGAPAPVPVRAAVCGLGGLVASSAMFSIPLRIPVAEGANVTLIVQIAPAGTLPAQESFSAKSEAFVPEIVMLERVRTLFPVLPKVTLCAALVAPIIAPGNVRLLGERLAIRVGAIAVPVSGTVSGLLEKLFAIFRRPTRLPIIMHRV
jgi:hypothetical protein